MILNQTRSPVESSGLLSEKFFGVSDLGMIFEILRSKLYSNPILAVCREITCNARDAHREVGKFDEPIHIHLPVGLEPEFRVKDFGPGISPDRMENIFINYTSSTKRGDNIQTGAFGIGSKSPWAVSDTFTITTVFDHIRYQYVCYIDETKIGKLSLLSEIKTVEPNSTEIAIPVKPIDFNYFTQWTEQACRHWTTKPITTGNTIRWQTLNKIIEGDRWAIVSDGDSWNKTAKIVIDGIEYPLEIDALRKYADPKIIDAARGTFVMYYGVGELSLSANREQIFLDKPTQDKIKDRLNEITKELKTSVETKIDSFPDLWTANVYYRKELNQVFNGLSFMGPLSWKGNILNNGYVELNCKVYGFQRGKYSRKTGHDDKKLTRSIGYTLDFQEKSQLYLNDLPIKEPTPRHVKKAFENDPTLNHIQVVCPSDKQSEDDLNKKHHLDLMLPKKLSAITKASARAYTPAASRLLVFKFDTVTSAFRQVSYDFMEQDPNEKVICLLSRDNYPTPRMPTLAGNKALTNCAISSLLVRHPKISLYGVDKNTDKDRVEDEFSDFKSLDEFIDEDVLNNKAINFVEIKFSHEHHYGLDERMINHLDAFNLLITNNTSLFLTRLKLHLKIRKFSDKDKGLLDVYELIKGEITEADLKTFVQNNPDWDIEKINTEYTKKYPLLGAINIYNLSQVVEHVADYVNMIDKI